MHDYLIEKYPSFKSWFDALLARTEICSTPPFNSKEMKGFFECLALAGYLAGREDRIKEEMPEVEA